jgi:hypothetical protein
MDITLFAVALAVTIGIAHSVLGERFILIRLFRRTDIPHLFGSPEFTKHTLRFAWHLTTVAWWGLAAIIVLIAQDRASSSALLHVLSATFLVSALVAAVGSRLRHLSWVAFAMIAVLLLVAARSVP